MSRDVQEALNAAGVGALIPKIIDPMLLELQRRYSPLVRSTPSQRWDSTVYYFNQRTARASGGFVTDGGARPQSQSVYQQNQFTIRNMQAVGSVTGYAQAVTRQVIGDLRAREVSGTIQGLYWDIEAGMLWGNEGSTQFGPYPQFSGLDSLISDFTSGTKNSIDQGGNPLTLAMLDQIIDSVEMNAATSIMDASYQLIMSSTANSKIAQLLTNQQRFVDNVEVAAGLIVMSYRGIPIIKSSFLGARNFSMGAIGTATATTGGQIAASASYRYKVSAVIARQGEIGVSAEAVQAVGGGTSTNTITLSFALPTGLDGAQPILYKIYRTANGGATNTQTLLGIVDAVVGVGADGITPVMTTSIVDDGVKLIPMNGATAPAITPSAYVGTNVNLLPPGAGQENIFLMPRTAEYVMRPYVREVQPVEIYPTVTGPDQLPYALVADTVLAVRGPRYLGRLARVGVSL
jgi:hypothetical protein